MSSVPDVEVFTCTRLKCRLPLASCASRYRASNRSKGKDDIKARFGPKPTDRECTGCPIGEYHATMGTPSPGIVLMPLSKKPTAPMPNGKGGDAPRTAADRIAEAERLVEERRALTPAELVGATGVTWPTARLLLQRAGIKLPEETAAVVAPPRPAAALNQAVERASAPPAAPRPPAPRKAPAARGGAYTRYPEATKEAVLAALVAGRTHFDVCEAFKVASSTLDAWVTRWRKEGRMPDRTPAVSPGVRERVAELRTQGLGLHKIASTLGIPPQEALRYIRELDAGSVPTSPPQAPEEPLGPESFGGTDFPDPVPEELPALPEVVFPEVHLPEPVLPSAIATTSIVTAPLAPAAPQAPASDSGETPFLISAETLTRLARQAGPAAKTAQGVWYLVPLPSGRFLALGAPSDYGAHADDERTVLAVLRCLPTDLRSTR